MAKNVLNESQSEDFAPISTTSDAAEAKIGWYDATLNASFWLARNDLTPLEAATLLCQQNPHDYRSAPSLTSTDRTTPDDFKKLLRTFEEAARDGQHRTLKNWLSIARNEKLKYHPWIDGYFAASDAVNLAQSQTPTVGNSIQQSSTVTDVDSEIPPEQRLKPLQRQLFQEQKIINTLMQMGYNPKSIPKWKAGKPGVKKKVWESLESDVYWSKKVFDKAWQRLRDAGEIDDKL